MFHIVAVSLIISFHTSVVTTKQLFILPVYYHSTSILFPLSQKTSGNFIKHVLEICSMMIKRKSVYVGNLPQIQNQNIQPIRKSINTHSVEIELVKSVLMNYTILTKGDPELKWDLLPYEATLKVLPIERNGQLSLITTRESFSFISCGKPAATGLNFSIYISPYDIISWLFALILLTTLGIFVSILNIIGKITRF